MKKQLNFCKFIVTEIKLFLMILKLLLVFSTIKYINRGRYQRLERFFGTFYYTARHL